MENAPVLGQLNKTLDRLRKTLWARTEQAYVDRDAKGANDQAQSYASGEAHAYGVAEEDVRDAQRDWDN
jgi:hypothetical protein